MSLERDLARLPGARVLVVGDVMLDEYVWGSVRRISPEAPVPVVDVHGRSHLPGGAANTAAGIAALGCHAILGGVVGDDPQGERLRAALRERGIADGGLLVVPGRLTTSKMRIIAQGQQVVRADHEERSSLPADLEQQLLQWAEDELEGADVLILSDYAKGVISPTLARGLIDLAAARSTPIVVDPKGTAYAKYLGATVLTPNVHDAKRAAGIAAEAYAELDEVAHKLASQLPGSALLITRGAEGMSLIAGEQRLDIPAQAKDVFDVTGAGDTVVAALGVAIGRRLPLERAVRLANFAAGAAVSKIGTSSVTLDEVVAELERAGGSPAPGPEVDAGRCGEPSKPA